MRLRGLRLAVLMAWLPSVAQAAEANWRCELEDGSVEWIRVDPAGSWREWRGGGWSENVCGGHPAYSCRTRGNRMESETFARDPDTRGTFRVVDALDIATGAFHRRVLDNTFILTTGTRIERNSYASCKGGAEPVPDSPAVTGDASLRARRPSTAATATAAGHAHGRPPRS